MNQEEGNDHEEEGEPTNYSIVVSILL